MLLTYKFRIKDSSCRRRLEAHARAVNFVWNYLCETQRHAERWGKKWPTHFDFTMLTVGTSRELGLLSETLGEICRVFTNSRNAIGHCPRWRSHKKSLGWIPIRGRAVILDGDAVIYRGERYRLWLSREIKGEPKTGNFVRDARGRWYFALTCELEPQSRPGAGAVGIDLGLYNLAVCSNGFTVAAPQHYRRYEKALGDAQRAHKKKRMQAVSAKIANARKHHLHVQSARIARENGLIVVGNVSSAQFKRTKMAKSVSDAGWSMLRNQLRYKASRHGAVYLEVDERFTSQTCSACGCIPASSPKGMGALGVRSWVCSECGEVHDRDLNAARNILRIGLERQAPMRGALAA